MSAPTSIAWHVTASRWLRIRVISRNIVRITCARRGTVVFVSVSTAIEYPCSCAIIET